MLGVIFHNKETNSTSSPPPPPSNIQTKMSCYVYFFIYVQVIADRDYGPGEQVRFWEFFFIYLF